MKPDYTSVLFSQVFIQAIIQSLIEPIKVIAKHWQVSRTKFFSICLWTEIVRYVICTPHISIYSRVNSENKNINDRNSYINETKKERIQVKVYLFSSVLCRINLYSNGDFCDDMFFLLVLLYLVKHAAVVVVASLLLREDASIKYI